MSAPVVDNAKPMTSEGQTNTNEESLIEKKRKHIAEQKAKKKHKIANFLKKLKSIKEEYKKDKLLSPEEKKVQEEREEKARVELDEFHAKEKDRARQEKEYELRLRVAKMKAAEKRFCQAMSGITKELTYMSSAQGLKEQLQINAHAEYHPSTFGLPVGDPIAKFVAVPIAAVLNMVNFVRLFMVRNVAKLALKVLGEPLKSDAEMAELKQQRRERKFKNLGFMKDQKTWAKFHHISNDDLIIPQEIADDPKEKANNAKKILNFMAGLSTNNKNTNSVVGTVSKNKEKDSISI